MPQFRQLCIHFNIFILYASSVCIEIRKKGQKGGKGKKSFVFWLMLSLCICTSIKSNIHHRQRPLDLCYVISYTYFKLNYQNRKNVLVSWSNSILKYKEKSNVRTAFYSVDLTASGGVKSMFWKFSYCKYVEFIKKNACLKEFFFKNK